MFVICKSTATEAEVLKDLVSNFAADGAEHVLTMFMTQKKMPIMILKIKGILDQNKH